MKEKFELIGHGDSAHLIRKYKKHLWNKSLGTSHLKTMATMLKNDADTIAAYLKNF